MSLKKNILANYISQIYATGIGIVVVPLYIKYMGPEAYGLVGFFSMLFSWFTLLDMGLTPTMARETARFRGGALDAITFRRLVKVLEGIFLVIALLGGSILLLLSSQIATNWLNAKQLPISEVQRSIQMMAVTISFRWMSGLYRGQISGSEQLVWLSGYNTVIATMRFVGVISVLNFISTTPTAFFSYQLCVALIELAGLKIMSYRMLPQIPAGERIAWSWAPLKPVFMFSLTIAFTSAAWVMITQTDKLVLSKILPLAEYGFFTLAVLVASGIMIISGPVSGAIIPRMTKLEAEGDHAGLIRVYRQSTQLVAVIACSAAATISLCAEPLLWAWTRDRELAQHAAPILILYAIGNGIQAISAFPSYLQFAKGNLRLHLIGNAIFVLLLIPTIIWAASHYGGVGAGYAWLAMNIVYFVLWIPLVHSRFASGLHMKWLWNDIAPIALLTSILGMASQILLSWSIDRWQILIQVGLIALILLFGACLASSFARMTIVKRFLTQR